MGVAEEVRKLAEESGHAASEISELIAEMQGQTRRVVGVVADGSASTQQTSASTQEIAATASDLARTAEELDALVRRLKVPAAAV